MFFSWKKRQRADGTAAALIYQSLYQKIALSATAATKKDNKIWLKQKI